MGNLRGALISRHVIPKGEDLLWNAKPLNLQKGNGAAVRGSKGTTTAFGQKTGVGGGSEPRTSAVSYQKRPAETPLKGG